MTYIRPNMMVRQSMGDGFVDEMWNFVSDTGAIDASQAPPADNVMQTTTGGNSTTAADFVNVGGICKPQNFPALDAVRLFQGQLNRVAQMKGFSKVSVDGAVGPSTLALFRKVQSSASPGTVMGDASSCMGVAPDVDVLGQQIQQFADSLGAPAVVAGPTLSLSAPTIKTKSGQTVLAPDADGIAASLAKLSGTEKIALLGAAGLGLLYLTKRKKGKK